MRIESSLVSLEAAHSSLSATAVLDETLSRPPIARPTFDSVQISAAAAPAANEFESLNPKQQLAVLILEAVFGDRIRWIRLQSPGATGAVVAPAAAEIHRRTEVHSESERTTFQAEGLVKTADGRSIQFAASLTMEREFQSYSVTTGPIQSTDPLVVNFSGPTGRVSDAKISFDLTADGKPETISFVAEGSGFLVLDQNGDGRANDGGELFGPRTGNGFGELAAYDEDRNGWIDESDSVFTKLRIWTRDGFSTLLEKGVGAISTASVETPFAIKDGTNTLLANVRNSGVYLSESGAAGTIQQLDLAEL